MLNVLVVSLCEPVILKLKLLGGEKLEYYKSVGGITKMGGPNFEISVSVTKRGFLTHFTLNIMYIHSQVPYIFVRS